MGKIIWILLIFSELCSAHKFHKSDGNGTFCFEVGPIFCGANQKKINTPDAT
jgi:hypothetical protein